MDSHNRGKLINMRLVKQSLVFYEFNESFLGL